MLVTEILVREPRYFVLPSDPEELLALAGARISIVIISQGRDFTRLGIEAPRSIRIVRESPQEVSK